MKKIIFIVALIISGVFTSCTDLSEDVVQNQIEEQLQSTTGNQNLDTGGEDGQTPIDDDEED
ncbi:hypothetical protein [uncultured Tenacibaculum sp.]|uniref:hypothetical protein n=1 Tax=uncultured Tenacibaculum sp. TaxID=174713 RepID=UPI0026172BCC|nr:hypothetical protein [uncultured Tenacibaculum sp.]